MRVTVLCTSVSCQKRLSNSLWILMSIPLNMYLVVYKKLCVDASNSVIYYKYCVWYLFYLMFFGSLTPIVGACPDILQFWKIRGGGGGDPLNFFIF